MIRSPSSHNVYPGEVLFSAWTWLEKPPRRLALSPLIRPLYNTVFRPLGSWV